MKKMCVMAALVMAGLFVGCASNKSGNPVAEWQNDRMFQKEITAKATAGAPLTLQDVTYKSTIDNPALAPLINDFAVIPAALYFKVATEVDKLAAAQEGRLIYLGIQNDIANGAKFEDLKGNMTPEQLTAYKAYENSVKQCNQASIIDDVIKPMLEQLTVESAKVAVLIQTIKENPEIAKLAGFELIKAMKPVAADGAALGQQFADATAGANLWLQLLQKDKEAKAFMKDYPVE